MDRSLAGFSTIIPWLSQRWHVYALNYRGHGKSDHTRDGYRPENLVKDITGFIEDIISEPAVLFGPSAGGMMALLVGSKLPGVIKALIIGDSPLDIEHHVTQVGTNEMKNHWTSLREIAGKPMEDLVVALKGKLDPADIKYSAKTLSQVDPKVLDYHADGLSGEFFSCFYNGLHVSANNLSSAGFKRRLILWRNGY